jgi:hypothetical protein
MLVRLALLAKEQMEGLEDLDWLLVQARAGLEEQHFIREGQEDHWWGEEVAEEF